MEIACGFFCLLFACCFFFVFFFKLGAGTAVPGIVAALCGGVVTLTDKEGDPRLLDNLRKTCEINNVAVMTTAGGGKPQALRMGVVSQITPLSWGVFSPAVLQLPPQEIILASDCFYDSKG